MKRTLSIYLSILFACSVICLQTKAFAQMQSVLNPSTERSINLLGLSLTPKKSLSVNNYEIVTFCQDTANSNNFNLFCKTMDGSIGVDIAHPITDTITNFDYNVNNAFIVFCGNSNQQGFIGYENITTLFSNSQTSQRFDLTNIQSLQKIYYYYDGTDDKLALIGDGNKLIDFNLSTATYDVYESQYYLLDIAITDDYVVVLGKVSDTEFIIYAHEKKNIPNFTDMSFTTPQAMEYDNNDVYYLTALDQQSNQVMVAFSDDNDHLNEHCVVDLNSLTVVDDQITITDIGKPIIIDLEYVSGSNTVLCLSYNTTFGSYIYDVIPYGGTYTVTGIVPNTSNNIFNKWLYNIASYDNAYYLAVGKISSTGGIYFFDKKIGNLNQSNCYTTQNCDLTTVNNVQPNTSYGYINIYSDTPQSATISFNSTGNTYNIDCQENENYL